MAPLPPDSTARLFVDYTVCGHQHTAQVRFRAPATADDAIAAFNDVIGAIGEYFFLTTVNSVRVAAEGSNISNPYPGTWPTGWGAGAGVPAFSARYCDFVGRSLDGRRVRLALFGFQFEYSGTDFRMNAAEDDNVAAAVDALNAAEGVMLSINGFQPLWYAYADIGDNAYWRNQIR